MKFVLGLTFAAVVAAHAGHDHGASESAAPSDAMGDMNGLSMEHATMSHAVSGSDSAASATSTAGSTSSTSSKSSSSTEASSSAASSSSSSKAAAFAPGATNPIGAVLGALAIALL